MILFGLFGGVAADRWDRRRLIIATQCAAAAQALILGVLTWSGSVRVWQVFVLAVVVGIINVFDMPARQSFVVDMVDDRADLGNAIAMNSMLVNASRMIGPAAAGLLIGAFGEYLCFLLNAASFGAVIASLLMMRLPRRPEAGEDTLAQAARQVEDGLRYAWGHADIRDLLIMLSVISAAGVPFLTLMPVFADRILGGGARTVGWLTAATGAGALGAALFLARRGRPSGLKRVGGLSAAGFGAALVLFSLSRSLSLSLAFMVLTGFFMMTAFTGSNTLLQTLTSDAMRGRVMGLFAMTFMGVAPFGNLLAGFAAERAGAPLTVATGGVLCLLCAAEFLRRSAAAEETSAPSSSRRHIRPLGDVLS